MHWLLGGSFLLAHDQDGPIFHHTHEVIGHDAPAAALCGLGERGGGARSSTFCMMSVAERGSLHPGQLPALSVVLKDHK